MAIKYKCNLVLIWLFISACGQESNLSSEIEQKELLLWQKHPHDQQFNWYREQQKRWYSPYRWLKNEDQLFQFEITTPFPIEEHDTIPEKKKQ